MEPSHKLLVTRDTILPDCQTTGLMPLKINFLIQGFHKISQGERTKSIFKYYEIIVSENAIVNRSITNISYNTECFLKNNIFSPTFYIMCIVIGFGGKRQIDFKIKLLFNIGVLSTQKMKM